MSSRGVSLIQLICGQASVALLMAVVPGLLILGVFGGLPWATCVGGLLVSAHLLIMALEFAGRGHWTPTGWRAVATMGIPVIDVLMIAWFLQNGVYHWALIALGLLFLAASLFRRVILRWKSGDRDDDDLTLPISGDDGMPSQGADNDLAMMDF